MGKKKIIVADIHGQISVFRQVYSYIVDAVKKDNTIEVGFVGDYGDRGEGGKLNKKSYKDIGSREVYLLLIELRAYFLKNNIKHFFLRGNHERELLGYIDNKKNVTMSYIFPLENAYEGMCAKPSIIEKVKDFLQDTKLYHLDEEQKQLFVHAGIDPHMENILESDPSYFLWAREHFFNSKRTFPYRVVFGHTKMAMPMVKLDRIGIDGGAYENGWLNVLLFDDNLAKIISFDKNGTVITRCEE